MRVVSYGTRRKTPMNAVMRRKCADCESVIEMTRAEMASGQDRDGLYYTFRCPVCGHENYVDARIVEDGR